MIVVKLRPYTGFVHESIFCDPDERFNFAILPNNINYLFLSRPNPWVDLTQGQLWGIREDTFPIAITSCDFPQEPVVNVALCGSRFDLIWVTKSTHPGLTTA
jgi:hypothetical protein